MCKKFCFGNLILKSALLSKNNNDKSMIKNNNKLGSLARSNAYIRSKQFNGSVNYKQMGAELPKEIRDWLITGEGEAFATVEMCDIALSLTCIDVKELSLEDNKIYLEYLYNLKIV